MWTRVTLVVSLVTMGARGDEAGHHHPDGVHHAHHHGHDLRDQEAAEAGDQPVLYYANPEDPSQVYSHQQDFLFKPQETLETSASVQSPASVAPPSPVQAAAPPQTQYYHQPQTQYYQPQTQYYNQPQPLPPVNLPQYQYNPYPAQPVQLTNRIQSRIDLFRSRVDSLQSRMAQGMTNMRSNMRNMINHIVGYYRGFLSRLDQKAKSRSDNASDLAPLIFTLSSLVIGAVLSM